MRRLPGLAALVVTAALVAAGCSSSSKGGGHTWPGSIHIDSLGRTTDQIDASATIWKFFQAHPLTAKPS